MRPGVRIGLAMKSICPHCQGHFGNDDEVVTCSSCHSLQHQSCWGNAGRCTVSGCAGSGFSEVELSKLRKMRVRETVIIFLLAGFFVTAVFVVRSDLRLAVMLMLGIAILLIGISRLARSCPVCSSVVGDGDRYRICTGCGTRFFLAPADQAGR